MTSRSDEPVDAELMGRIRTLAGTLGLTLSELVDRLTPEQAARDDVQAALPVVVSLLWSIGALFELQASAKVFDMFGERGDDPEEFPPFDPEGGN